MATPVKSNTRNDSLIFEVWTKGGTCDFNISDWWVMIYNIVESVPENQTIPISEYLTYIIARLCVNDTSYLQV